QRHENRSDDQHDEVQEDDPREDGFKGNAPTRRTCGPGISKFGPIELFRVGRRQRLDILDTLRSYSEFVPTAWHGYQESWRLRVRLYLAPQASDKHIDAALIGFRATPGNGVTEVVTRQYTVRAVQEYGQ